MTIIIESGQAGADSVAYCSVADADAYHIARGVAAWAALTTEQKESALVRGCDYLTGAYRARWTGQRVSSTQALDFPRYNVPQPDGIAGYLPHDSVPREVVQANAEMALRAAAGELLEDIEPTVASETVGPLSTTYFQGASKLKKYPAVDRLLAPLLGGQGGLKLVRA